MPSQPVRLSGIACRRLHMPRMGLDDVFVEFDGSRIGTMGVSGSSWMPPGAFNAREDGLRVVPGLIDVHIHGCAGADWLDRTPEAMQAISRQAATRGCTTLVATTTIPVDDRADLKKFSRLVEMIRAHHAESAFELPVVEGRVPLRRPAMAGAISGHGDIDPSREMLALPGARVAGIHLEGPWLSPEKPGSFGSRYLGAVDLEMADRILDLAGDIIVKVTLAPELEHGEELLDLFTTDPRSRAEVSFAHTTMGCEEARRWFDACPRARHVTHAFNAMEPMRHREPGLIGAALMDDRVAMEVIPDGVHVHPTVVALLARVKGPKLLMAITDATGASGTAPGTLVESIAGTTMVIDGVVRRVSDGTISGADIGMSDALDRLQRLAGVEFEDALEMCTATPAAHLHCSGEFGDIDAGKRADFTVLRDDGTVYATIRDGLLVYQA